MNKYKNFTQDMVNSIDKTTEDGFAEALLIAISGLKDNQGLLLNIRMSNTKKGTREMTKPRLDQGADYERGFVDGMSKQAQSSVDKAVNAMTQPTYYIPSKDQRTWVGLTDEELREFDVDPIEAKLMIAKLKKKNT